ncbi:MAG: PqqD family protein [Chloroflexota bacterium]
MNEVVPIQNQNVAYTIIEEEAALVHPVDSSLYWLNPVATRIWELSDGQNSIAAIADALCQEFDVDQETALADALKMIESFRAKQLIQMTGG